MECEQIYSSMLHEHNRSTSKPDCQTWSGNSTMFGSDGQAKYDHVMVLSAHLNLLQGLEYIVHFIASLA